MGTVPAKARLEHEAVLPALLVAVERHIDVPGLPGPFPARVRDCGVGDVDGRRGVGEVCPGGRIEGPEGLGGVVGAAEEEAAALVFP